MAAPRSAKSGVPRSPGRRTQGTETALEKEMTMGDRDQEERTMYREDQSGSSFMLGIMTGAVVGAGVALLFAPRTGEETRQQLGEQYRGLAERAGQTAQSLREG